MSILTKYIIIRIYNSITKMKHNIQPQNYKI